MKNTLLFLLIPFTLIQCKNSNNTENEKAIWNSIKSVEHHQLVAQFLLHYPQSIYFDTAFQYFNELQEIAPPPPPYHCWKECAEIIASKKMGISFNDNITEINNISDSSLNLILNGKPHFERRFKKIIDQNGVEREYSTGRFDIFYSSELPTKNYLQPLLTQINKSITDYKEILAQEWYDLDYNSIHQKGQSQLDSILYFRILLTVVEEDFFRPPPPPPPSIKNRIEHIENVLED